MFRIKFAVIGASCWGVLLISCVVSDRSIVAPPQIAGAEFVGSQECAMCHEEIIRDFNGATHAKLVARGENAKAMACEACHGAGSLHVKAGGGADTIINPGRSPQACFQCHLNMRGQFALPSRHPVLEGHMTCTDCHDPHRGTALPEGGTRLARVNESCLRCHMQQAGPFVFEHEALRDGCLSCHDPHGSVNARLLRVRNHNLCLQCHFQQQTSSGQLLIGGRNHAAFVQRGTCWSAGCHEAVHGSHVNRSLRF